MANKNRAHLIDLSILGMGLAMGSLPNLGMGLAMRSLPNLGMTPANKHLPNLGMGLAVWGACILAWVLLYGEPSMLARFLL
jgi:hypothetical protein